MKIDFWRLSRLILQAQQLLSAQQTIPKGDAGLYLVLRYLCEQLESTNPGIADAAGFDFALSVLRNLPGSPWRPGRDDPGEPTGPLAF
jgi:hypothetical protein